MATPKHWFAAAVLLPLMMALALDSCGSGGHQRDVGEVLQTGELPDGPPLLEPSKDWYRVLYYPFVEDIVIPEPVYEQTPFEIDLMVSADYRPSVLRGYPYTRKRPDDGQMINPDNFMVDLTPNTPPGYDGMIGLDQYIFGSYLTGKGDSVDHFVYEFPSGLPAGKYLLRTGTVRERRAGGAGVIIGEDMRTVGGDPIMHEVGTTMMEVDLVVHPLEGTS